MMHGDLRGFYGAPITYAYTLAVGAASSATLLFDKGSVFTLDPLAIQQEHQFWRLAANQFSFNHGLAASFGLYTIFQYRVLERQMGSRKFGSFTVFVLLITGALECAVVYSAPSFAKDLPSGPYAFLGVLSAFYYKFIPKLNPRIFSVANLHFSDKSTTYLLLSVMLVRNPMTLASFLPGTFLGYLFGCTPLGKLRLPSFVSSAFSILKPFFDVNPPSAALAQRQRRMQEAQRRLNMHRRENEGNREQLLPGARRAPPPMAAGMIPPEAAARPPVDPPSEESITRLVALGFEREQAQQALEAADNNVEAAANRLLNGM